MLVKRNLVHQGQLPSYPLMFVLPPAPAAWEVVPQYTAPPAPLAPQQNGMPFGMFLAIGSSLWSAAVMLDPNASKEQKAIAQAVLGIALPFALKPAFELQTWPGQWN
jgi:hypothetical protein